MSQYSPLYILRDHAYIILKSVFLSMKIDFVFANSADPDEMQQIYLNRNCHFRGFQSQRCQLSLLFNVV